MLTTYCLFLSFTDSRDISDEHWKETTDTENYLTQHLSVTVNLSPSRTRSGGQSIYDKEGEDMGCPT